MGFSVLHSILINILFAILFTLSLPLFAKQTILFVNPSTKADPFWHKVELISQHAAKQLGFDMKVIYGEGNRHIQIKELKKYLQHQKKPDFAVLILYPGGAIETLNTLEKYQLPSITLEQTISGDEKRKILEPGNKYKFWLGQVYHDNYAAGYSLAKTLHESLKNKQHAKAVLINGHYGSESDMRAKGAFDYFNRHNVEVAQEVYAAWSREVAAEQVNSLLKRHINIKIVWSASDMMALGALDTCNKVCSEDEQIVIGGFDWLSVSLEKIQKGEIQASIGGHFMMGAWALVSIFDNIKKHPYWKNSHNVLIPMDVITQENIQDYLWVRDQTNWSEIDYRAKSLHLSKQSSYQLYLLPKIDNKH